MTYKICEWDSALNAQVERDATPEEVTAFDAQKAAAMVPVVPQQVTRRQALQALLIRGVTSAMIETAINGLPISDLEKALALIEFRESLEFEYARPLTIQMCAVMGLNRDDLFIFAATL